MGFATIMVFGAVTGITPIGQKLMGAETAEAAYYAGVNVVDIQRAVNIYHLNGTHKQIGLDGINGRDTRAAITNFQIRNGLYVDGLCGKTTWGKLKLYNVMGANNYGVYAIQGALNYFRNFQPNIAYSKYLVRDGIAGYETTRALICFQRAKGLPQTGYLDTTTFSRLSPYIR